MNKYIYVLLIAFVVYGCQEQKPVDKSISGIKIKDLAAKKAIEPNSHPVSSDFTIFIFNIPTGNTQLLGPVWENKNTRAVTRAKPDAFSKGNFMALYGEGEQWNEIATKLNEAGGHRGRIISIMLPQGKGHFMDIANTAEDATVFLPSQYGKAEGITLGSGKIGFYLRSDARAGPKGVCMFSLVPAFEPYQFRATTFKPQLDPERINFPQLGISSQMAAGSFILLGPKYVPESMSISQLFFEQGTELQIYLVVCNRVSD